MFISLFFYFQAFLLSPIDRDCLKQTIAMMESSGGKNKTPRFERAFLNKYGNSGVMPKLRKFYGDEAAASSYGKYQIMLCVAWERGFSLNPEQLQQDEWNEKVYTVVIERLIRKHGDKNQNIRAILMSYNGGGNPSYGDKGLKLYQDYWRRKHIK